MATDTWTFNGVANWNTAADWSGGVPTSTSDVVVAQGDPQITSAISINSLTLSNLAEVDFINAGTSTIAGAVNNASYLTLDATANNGGSNLTIGGVLTNTGIVQLGSTNNSLSKSDMVTVAGIVNHNGAFIGDLEVAGGNSSTAQMLVNDASAAGFGAAGVLYGIVHLSGYSTIEFASGQITTIAANSALQLNGRNAFIADGGSLTTNSALSGLALNAGAISFDNGPMVTTTGAFTNLGSLEISSMRYNPNSVLNIGGNLLNAGAISLEAGSFGGSSLTVNGVLKNNGMINAGAVNAGRSTNIVANGLVNNGNGYNAGVINLASGPTAAVRTAMIVKSAAGFGAAGVLTGEVSLSGYAGIMFSSGQISTIQGGLSLTGSAAFLNAGGFTPGANSALKGLKTVSGFLGLNAGAAITTTGALSNSGTIYLDSFYYGMGSSAGGGSSLTVGGALTNGAYSTLNIGNSNLLGADTVTATGVANTGVINVAGNFYAPIQALLNVTSGVAGFGTAGAVSGQVSVAGDAEIEFVGGQISSIQAGAVLALDGPNAFVADAGALTSNSALAGLNNVSGTLTIGDGASVSTTGALTNNGSLELDNASVFSTTMNSNGLMGGSSLKIGGVLTNSAGINPYGPSGGVYIGNSSMTASDTVTATGISNSGMLVLAGGASSSAKALLNISGAAGFGTAGVLSGDVSLSGNSIIEFGGGQISSVANGASLSLNGPNALIADAGALTSNSALAGLSLIANNGSLQMSNGAKVTTTAGLTNSGTLYLDANGGGGGSSLKVGGVLTNSSNLYLNPITQSDTIAATGLANTGSINLYGGASSAAEALLNISGAAGFGTAGQLSGTVTLSGNSMIEFGSGKISSIAGGASLTLNGPNALIADAGALTSNSALAGLATNSGTVSLENGVKVATTVGLTNSGTIILDTNGGGGGSNLKVGGVLTNSSSIQTGIFDTTGAQSPTTISATGGIVNNGAINNQGGDEIISSAVTGTGSILLYGYGSNTPITEFDSTVGSGQNVYFEGPGEIVFGTGAAQGFAATVNGWSANDLIDVKGFGTGTTESFAGNVLTLTDGSKVAHLTFAAGLTSSNFSLTNTATDSIVKFA